MLNVLVCQMSNWVSGVQSVCSRNWFAKCPTGSVESNEVACAFSLPNVQLGQWSPKCSLVQLVCQKSNCIGASNEFAHAIGLLNVQLGRWIQCLCAIVSFLCMYSKLFVTGNKAIPSSSSRWHLCLHARLFVN